MDFPDKIFVAGHNGLVGGAIVRALTKAGYSNLILKNRAELDLTNTKAVADFFAAEKPTYVFLAAAKVGGIMANSKNPADFIYQNLLIQNNVIHQAYLNKVKKLLFLGSSCVYPRLADQPIKESALMTGPLEPTNESYAVAKIAGITMCQSYNRQYGTNFISLMPSNLYGPGDKFDLETSHVIPSLIKKFHQAKQTGEKTVTIWGSGQPKREFLYVDDLADACLFLMQNYDQSEIINVGSGQDVTIKELAETIKTVTDCNAEILWDTTKPDGMPRKLLNVDKLGALGWTSQMALTDGLIETYRWFTENVK